MFQDSPKMGIFAVGTVLFPMYLKIYAPPD